MVDPDRNLSPGCFG